MSRTAIFVAMPMRALAADECAAQIEADGFGVETAEHRDLAIGQHDLERDDVRDW